METFQKQPFNSDFKRFEVKGSDFPACLQVGFAFFKASFPLCRPVLCVILFLFALGHE